MLTEIESTAVAMEQVFGERPRFFCYPLGRFNETTIQLLKESGHLTATTISDGTMKYSSDPLRMSRLRIRNTTAVSTLAWLVNRFI